MDVFGTKARRERDEARQLAETWREEALQRRVETGELIASGEQKDRSIEALERNNGQQAEQISGLQSVIDTQAEQMASVRGGTRLSFEALERHFGVFGHTGSETVPQLIAQAAGEVAQANTDWANRLSKVCADLDNVTHERDVERRNAGFARMTLSASQIEYGDALRRERQARVSADQENGHLRAERDQLLKRLVDIENLRPMRPIVLPASFLAPGVEDLSRTTAAEVQARVDMAEQRLFGSASPLWNLPMFDVARFADTLSLVEALFVPRYDGPKAATLEEAIGVVIDNPRRGCSGYDIGTWEIFEVVHGNGIGQPGDAQRVRSLLASCGWERYEARSGEPRYRYTGRVSEPAEPVSPIPCRDEADAEAVEFGDMLAASLGLPKGSFSVVRVNGDGSETRIR